MSDQHAPVIQHRAVRRLLLPLVGLALLAGAGCGGDDKPSAGGGTTSLAPASTLPPVSTTLVTPSSECVTAMAGLATAWKASEVDQQPKIDATLTACRTAAEWDAAADGFRSTQGVDSPHVVEGADTNPDVIRAAYCNTEQGPPPPACTYTSQ
jgi:hypothetical protein